MTTATLKTVAPSQRELLRRRFWQSTTITLLVIGYAGYYLCRSDLSVTMPLISAELVARGLDPATAQLRLGSMASLGVLAYALGKFISGSTADFFGGRRNFLIGMGGSALLTCAFAFGGASLPLLVLLWMGNRAVQSTGWSGMVKVASKWFSRRTYGTVMALLSLSYLFGDAAAREFMALLIGRGFTWREVFLSAGAVLAILWLLTFCFLKETPLSIGQNEPEVNPRNLYKTEGTKATPLNLRELYRPMWQSRSLRLACLISLGFTLVRETFNLWTPTYFTQVAGLSPADAAAKSALFPLFGGLSVLAVGILSDRFGTLSRAVMLLCGLVTSGAALMYLALGRFPQHSSLPVIMVALIAFLLIGPYSLLAGAVAIDFGGRQGSATASGLIDGVGYLGGVLAGDTIARVSAAFGWSGAFITLAAVCFLSSIAALLYVVDQRRNES